MCQSQCVVETDGKKTPRNLPKATHDSGDGSGLDDEEKRPAVEKSPERPKRLAQINVLAAGLGHHRGQLAIAECADESKDRGDDPGAR